MDYVNDMMNAKTREEREKIAKEFKEIVMPDMPEPLKKIPADEDIKTSRARRRAEKALKKEQEKIFGKKDG